MYLPSYRAERSRTNPLDNFTSTADTVEKMTQLVWGNINSPYVHAALNQIWEGMISKSGNKTIQPSTLDWCRSIYWWVKRHVKFSEDERTLSTLFGLHDMEDGKELLLSPSFLLQMPYPTGDCDDFSTLIATLLVAAGVPHVFFCTIAADGREPNNFTHVYVKVQLNDGSMVPLDASHGKYPGWEHKEQYSSANWAVTSNAAQAHASTAPVKVVPQASPLTSSSLENVLNNYVKQQAVDFLGVNPMAFLGIL
jgi:hypothetical protein